MRIAKQTNVATCPDCEEEIHFSNALHKQGQKILCPHCEAYLQVVSVKPLGLDWEDSDVDDQWPVDSDW